MIEIPVRPLDDIETNWWHLYQEIVHRNADYRQIARDAASPKRVRDVG